MSMTILKDVRNVAAGVLLLTGIMIFVFFIIGRLNMSVVWGALLGFAVTVLNFFLLSLSVGRAVEKQGKGAQGMMGISYIIRLLIIAGAVVFAIKSPHINYVAAVIPLVFPRPVIMLLKMRTERK